MKKKSSPNIRLYILERAVLMAGLLIAPLAFGGLDVQCPAEKQQNLKIVNPPYVDTVGQELQKLTGATSVKCTSCMRTPDEQRAACHRICGADSCPGRCAPPGKSQHQKPISVCDLQGIPGSAQDACKKLAQICAEKYQGKCGIGGYSSGAHHFGAGDDHFSAWNQCGFLKNIAGAGAILNNQADQAAQEFDSLPSDIMNDLANSQGMTKEEADAKNQSEGRTGDRAYKEGMTRDSRLQKIIEEDQNATEENKKKNTNEK